MPKAPTYRQKRQAGALYRRKLSANEFAVYRGSRVVGTAYRREKGDWAWEITADDLTKPGRYVKSETARSLGDCLLAIEDRLLPPAETYQSLPYTPEDIRKALLRGFVVEALSGSDWTRLWVRVVDSKRDDYGTRKAVLVREELGLGAWFHSHLDKARFRPRRADEKPNPPLSS